jgi:hypothetical protein
VTFDGVKKIRTQTLNPKNIFWINACVWSCIAI